MHTLVHTFLYTTLLENVIAQFREVQVPKDDCVSLHIILEITFKCKLNRISPQSLVVTATYAYHVLHLYVKLE